MGNVPNSILSSFESQLAFCLESFLMSLGHWKHGKKVRKVRPGVEQMPQSKLEANPPSALPPHIPCIRVRVGIVSS